MKPVAIAKASKKLYDAIIDLMIWILGGAKHLIFDAELQPFDCVQQMIAA